MTGSQTVVGRSWQPVGMLRAVTANLGCAAPARAGPLPVEAAYRWSARVRDGVDLAFLQEVPPGLVGDWKTAGFAAAPVQGPRYRPRSALLWRRTRAELVDASFPTAQYHGSYLAVAHLRVLAWSTVVTCVSFHASPNPVERRYMSEWEACGQPLPDKRHGGGPYDDDLFDADMVVASLKLLASKGPVLAAGDLNECEQWDVDHGEHWWPRLHASVVSVPGQLEFPLRRLWGGELRTLLTGAGYQADHVIASPEVGARVDGDAYVDEPETSVGTSGAGSDHAPIFFSLRRLGPSAGT